MGEFKEASLWMRLALLLLVLSLLLDLFAVASGLTGAWRDVEACYIIGFLCLLVAVILVLGLVFLDELKGNKPALICLIVFSLLGGIATVIAVAMWGGHSNRHSGNLGTYPSMLGVLSGFLAIIAGVFAILEIVGCKK